MRIVDSYSRLLVDAEQNRLILVTVHGTVELYSLDGTFSHFLPRSTVLSGRRDFDGGLVRSRRLFGHHQQCGFTPCITCRRHSLSPVHLGCSDIGQLVQPVDRPLGLSAELPLHFLPRALEDSPPGGSLLPHLLERLSLPSGHHSKHHFRPSSF